MAVDRHIWIIKYLFTINGKICSTICYCLYLCSVVIKNIYYDNIQQILYKPL